MQRQTTWANAWLQAWDESIIGREVGGAIVHRGRSLISTIALFLIKLFKKLKRVSLFESRDTTRFGYVTLELNAGPSHPRVGSVWVS